MKTAARKLIMMTTANKSCTLLEALACIVLCCINNTFELGYNLNTPLYKFSFIKVRKRFSLHTRLDNEFGSVLSADWLLNVNAVCVQARSKGKGFAGVIKRHGFSGLRQSHGVSLAHRACGAIGARQDPGKVWKGTKMAGRLGGGRTTIKNVRVAQYNVFTCRVLVYGSVPGGTKSDVIIDG
ncbi:MAG: 50S ribosomal protein L3 [Candidatus Hodgkinia cicadicola]